jgi:poly(hydroxyalkanoate) depolymerase family esterase
MSMPDALQSKILQAIRLTGTGRLTEAAAFLQRMLQGSAPHAAAAETIATADAQLSTSRGAAFGTGAGRWSVDGMARPPMPEALRGLLDQVSYGGLQPPIGGLAYPTPAEAPAVVPDGAQFLTTTFSNQAGSRSYKLYVPSGYRGQAVPLIVMLHGCTQSPDDFAAGTRMNAVAEEHTCLVAYPAQTAAANSSKCWNWFSTGDQQRDKGEPSLIAGITRQVMRNYGVDPQRVYIAGLSAGGAAAAIMGTTYPDLYAAIGVHSGLAFGAASDMSSAFAAMRQGKSGAAHRNAGAPGSGNGQRIVPAIVFHGNRDTTVHPRNGHEVVAQALGGTTLQTRVQHGQAPDGHAYIRILHADKSGGTILEHWVIHAAGHAWAGGSPAGSYTDPCGPDATREMLRFFLDHPYSTRPA